MDESLPLLSLVCECNYSHGALLDQLLGFLQKASYSSRSSDLKKTNIELGPSPVTRRVFVLQVEKYPSFSEYFHSCVMLDVSQLAINENQVKIIKTEQVPLKDLSRFYNELHLNHLFLMKCLHITTSHSP